MSQKLLPRQELNAKIREYEQFANDVLKVDLQKTTELRAKYQLEIEELEELKRNIQQLQQVRGTQHTRHRRVKISECSHQQVPCQA